MLSSQTKDQVTFAAMEKLKAYELKIENILTTSTKKADVLSISPCSEQLEELWVVCGFIRRKWNYTIVL